MKKKVVKKKVKKSASKKSLSKRIESIEENQEKMLGLLRKVLDEEKIIEKEEEKELAMERTEIAEQSRVEADEEKELEELKKLEDLEKQIEKEVEVSPLKRITYRDITKGVIGAFFGIVGHFAFAEGVHIAEEFSVLRSTLLLATAFIIIIIFLYFAGFRRIDDKFVFKILPIRAIVIFISSLITIYLVLLLYGKIDFSTPFHAVYNTISAISILAVIGAGTADLIGKQEE